METGTIILFPIGVICFTTEVAMRIRGGGRVRRPGRADVRSERRKTSEYKKKKKNVVLWAAVRILIKSRWKARAINKHTHARTHALVCIRINMAMACVAAAAAEKSGGRARSPCCGGGVSGGRNRIGQNSINPILCVCIRTYRYLISSMVYSVHV